MSIKLPSIILLFILSISSNFAQNIKVLDEKSQKPISGVAVFNNDKSITGITDFVGNIDVSNFSDVEKITFQHISHINLILTKEEIIAAGNKVMLGVDSSALEEVVLSVSKFKQKKGKIPQKITSITSEDIMFSNPQTSADLLESSGNVYIQKSQLGGGSPIIRGFSTNRLLIAVDGIRFNTAIFRGGNVQSVISIDPFTVDHTEVILGPGSVVYGSDAIGGVMNFYTKKAKFSFKEGISFSGNTIARYATASEEKTGHIDFNVGLKEWAFLTSVSYTDFGDLKMGKYGPDDYLRPEYAGTINGEDVMVTNDDPRLQVPTAYDQINAMQKIRYMPSNNWDFNLGLFYTTTSDYPRYDRLIRERNGQLRSAVWDYTPQEWINGNLMITNKGTSFYDKSILTLSYQNFKEGRKDRNFGDDVLYETKEKVGAYTSAFDFIKKFGKSKLFYGLEYVYNKVNSNGKQTNINNGDTVLTASRYPEGSTWQSMAAYFSLQSKLAENLSFQAGLRYNHILLFANFDTLFYDFPFTRAAINTGALTGSAGINWQASDILNWRVNFSTAFRAPNIDDVGKIFDSEPGSVVVPNPDLKPEYAYTGELGAILNFENAVKIDITGYITFLEDALVRRDFSINGQTEIMYQGELSTIQAIQNGGKAEIYGFEAGVEINFTKNLQFTSQYNYTGGYQLEEDGSRVAVRHVAPQFGNAHLIWEYKKLKLDAYANYNGQFDYEDLAPEEQNKAYLYALDENGNPYSPSWYTLNFGAQYKINKAFQINTSLENISNQRYRTYSSGITAAGINFITAVSYHF
ncbi:MAG: TonB-dependent receptor [Flavobacteriaceae bacterium]|jgi:hemoglobin/transferrin/lactoferrin receptor protein|nr:TonB-dependent receptor [Flavobacteriaceae bacterium]MBT3920836.1 TonB-dependent receptor [Flavobacteriaceae bacterium]MBT6706120.1 TonB-dependent receptor [Flavobacteriaceae bacterium]MBT7243555.1 TonB-dependent receptor [Flavobacteriaceae bacterium]